MFVEGYENFPNNESCVQSNVEKNLWSLIFQSVQGLHKRKKFYKPYVPSLSPVSANQTVGL